MADVTGKKIQKALVSVFNKEGLEDVARALVAQGVELISTGGTEAYLREIGLECTSVEDITGYPSILGGRVKTLHPLIFGAILARHNNPDDQRQCEMYGIAPVDLVIVDLYPFRETVAAGGTDAEIIEKIDIGGVSLIRAAAKNFADLLIIPSRGYYPHLLKILERGGSTLEERKSFARAAFELTSTYDHEIQKYFLGERAVDELPLEGIELSYTATMPLRYGENPHQEAVFYGSSLRERFDQLHGKAISYNNLLDLDAAVHLIEEFEEPTAAIIKHNTPCGIASAKTISEAYSKALASDPISAFGGIIILNAPIDASLAHKIGEIFFEVLIAPDYSEEALEILFVKKNRIILKDKVGYDGSKFAFRTVLGGLLAQERDTKIEGLSDLKASNHHLATDEQLSDLLFAMKVVKYCKSNAIVLAKGKQVIGAGYGQTSRVDALKQAITKARELGFDIAGSVLASDAFFPFKDCVEIAAEAGVVAIIQPGGSIRDQESIELADQKGIPMYFTGIRHFRH